MIWVIFDKRVFSPNKRSHQWMTIYHRHEQQNAKPTYVQHVQEVESLFCTIGTYCICSKWWNGQGRPCFLYKRLAALFTQKPHQPYSATMGWLCTALSFALLRPALLCLQGSRTKPVPLPVSSNHALDLMVSEGRLGH